MRLAPWASMIYYERACLLPGSELREWQASPRGSSAAAASTCSAEAAVPCILRAVSHPEGDTQAADDRGCTEATLCAVRICCATSGTFF